MALHTVDNDTFPYGDGALTAVDAGRWAQITSFNDLTVDTGTVKGGGAGNGGGVKVASWAGDSANQWTEITFTTFAQFAGPCVFVQAAAGSFYYLDATNTTIDIYKVSATSFTKLGGWSTTWANGDTARLEVTVSGATATLSAYQNNALAGSLTDGTFLSGVPGIRAFDANPRIDTFVAGDFSASATVRLFALLGVGT